MLTLCREPNQEHAAMVMVHAESHEARQRIMRLTYITGAVHTHGPVATVAQALPITPQGTVTLRMGAHIHARS